MMAGHVLFTTHVLFGTTNFYVVDLPEGWSVLRPRLSPDADRSVQFGPYRWVQDGHAAYGVLDPERERLGELHVYARPADGERPPRLPSDVRAELSETPADVCDQQGLLRRGRLARRGRRYDLHVLEALGRCPHTQRWVLLQALGAPALLDAVAVGLPGGRCH